MYNQYQAFQPYNPLYQQQLPQPMPQPMQQPQPQISQQLPQQDEKIWVTGEEGAKAYLVARGEFVRLWDDKDNIFYEKEADASGRPTLRTYRYEQIESASEAKRNEAFKSLEDRVDALEQLVRNGAKNAKPNGDDEPAKPVC